LLPTLIQGARFVATKTGPTGLILLAACVLLEHALDRHLHDR
jgi:hypothetical protein